MSGPSPRRIAPAVWIFLLTFAVRLLVLIRFSNSLHFLPDGDDMKFYSDWALRIAAGRWTDGQAFYGLPGYAYFMALIFRLSGGYDPFIVGTLQAAVDAGIAVLLWKICGSIFAPGAEETKTPSVLRRPAFIGGGAALAWTFFTPAQAFSTVTMPTVWLVFAYYLCLWLGVKTQVSSWWKPWAFLGVFIGFIAMMVATILFAVPILAVAIVISVARGKTWSVRLPRVASAVAVLVAGIYLGAAPAWIHNYFVAHEPVMLSAHSGINFWIGNNPTSTGYPKMPPGIRATQEGLLRDSLTLAEEATGRPMKRYEVSKFWSAQANAYISSHFSSWLSLMGVKFGNFWNAYQYDDLSLIKLLRDDGVLPPGLTFGFIAALGLAGLIPVLIRFPRAGWVVAAVLLHMCALLPVFVTERYRLAAVPGLIILGSAGLWIFWENISATRWKPAALYLLLCAAAAWFVSIPRTDIGLWSLDHYKAGIRAIAAGDLGRAQRNLETAYAYVPTNADINFALGNLWLERSNHEGDNQNAKAHDRARAKAFYKQALDLNGRHTGTLNNLGVLAMEEKRWDLAERFFAASSSSEPTDAKAHYLLARARYEKGDLAGAKTALAEALHMRPSQKEFQELQAKLDEPRPAPPAPPAP